MHNKVKVRFLNKRRSRYMCSSKKWNDYANPGWQKRRWPTYWGVTVKNSVDGCHWWIYNDKKWGTWDEVDGRVCCTKGPDIYSVKAAIRHAKKHVELPVGTVLAINSNIVGVGAEIRIIGRE